MFTDPVPNRDALLSSLVMSAIADDYEDFAMVVHQVTGWAAAEGVHFSDDEIWSALRQLIERGLAKAYRLSATYGLQKEVADITAGDRAAYHFLLTRSGHIAMEQGSAT